MLTKLNQFVPHKQILTHVKKCVIRVQLIFHLELIDGMLDQENKSRFVAFVNADVW